MTDTPTPTASEFRVLLLRKVSDILGDARTEARNEAFFDAVALWDSASDDNQWHDGMTLDYAYSDFNFMMTSLYKQSEGDYREAIGEVFLILDETNVLEFDYRNEC